MKLSYHLTQNRIAVFYSRIKNERANALPTVTTSSVENGGQPEMANAPEREI
jgi:hypothetical protein